MNKKVLFALFVLVAVLTALTLVACDDSADKPEVETTGSPVEKETEAESVYAPPTNLPDALPATSSDTMTFLARSGGWTVRDLWVEEDSADTINHAIYTRNQKLLEDYGVTVEQVQVDVNEIYNHLYNAVAGGSASYDAVDMNLMDSFTAASSGILLDLETDIPYLSLDNPWWDQGTRADFSVKNKLYYTCSDINLMAYMATWVAVYNKGVLSDLGYDDDYIYDLVRDGKWTLDAYYNIVKTFSQDLNQDNNMTSVDQYGTSYQGSGPDGFLLCSGFRYCTKNEDDELVFNEFSDESLDILTKVLRICNPSAAYNSHNQKQNDAYSTNSENGRNMFTEERSIFFTETLESVDSFRDNESDFGIIPLPKYKEESEYTSYIHHWGGSAISVPINAPDLEKTGIVLDYMAYLSAEMVTPVYFNMVVEGKFSRDTNSLEMIEDYIMSNRIFDLVMANRIGGLPDLMLNLINTNQNAFASTYKRNSKAVTAKIEEYNEAFE